MSHHGVGASITTSAITAFVALIPDEIAGYALKLVSVLVLAMVAEMGRRLIGLLFSKKTP